MFVVVLAFVFLLVVVVVFGQGGRVVRGGGDCEGLGWVRSVGCDGGVGKGASIGGCLVVLSESAGLRQAQHQARCDQPAVAACAGPEIKNIPDDLAVGRWGCCI